MFSTYGLTIVYRTLIALKALILVPNSPTGVNEHRSQWLSLLSSSSKSGSKCRLQMAPFSIFIDRKKILAVDLDSLQREAPVTISWAVFKDPPLDVIHVMTRNYAKS
jgi:hypothetical protein